MKQIILLFLAFTGFTLQGQSGFFVYDNDTPVESLSEGDTLDLQDFYSNDYEVRYIFDQSHQNAIMTFKYRQSFFIADGIRDYANFSGSGSNYAFNNPPDMTFLTQSEQKLSGPYFDSLFIGGKLSGGTYDFYVGGGSDYGSISVFDSVKNVHMYWGAGKQDPVYYLIDPITHSPIVRLSDGDTINNVIGDMSALVEIVSIGPDSLNLMDVFFEYQDFSLFPDTLSFLKATPLVYTTEDLSDYNLIVLTGYSGSGEYFLKNQANRLDSGLTVYVQKPVGVHVELDTVYNTVQINDTIINLVIIPKDTFVYNYISQDTIVYNFIYQDSVQWTIIQKDSIEWTFIVKDSVVWNIISKDSIEWTTIFQDSIEWTIIQQDSFEYNIIFQDSIEWTILTKDSIQYNIILQDSIVFNFDVRDSIVYNLIQQDSIVWTVIQQDSIVWTIIQQDSIEWTIIQQDTIIYSDSVVYDTMDVDTYTDLVLPVLLKDLSQISGNAQALRNLLIRIRDEGLRDKELYEQLEGIKNGESDRN